MTPTKAKAAPVIDPRASALTLARMLWKQRFNILIAWVLLSAIGATIVWLLPTLYSSEALILVESQKIPEALVASTVNAEIQDRLATIRQQILSSTRLQKIIEKFSLYSADKGSLTREEIVEQMRKDIKITLERGWSRNQPGAFRISYTGRSPEVVASVANELTSLFIEENLRSREVQAVGTSEFLENQLQQAKKNLEEQEAKVSKYKVTHNGELPEQEQSLMGTLDRLNIQLQGNHEAVNRTQQTKNVLEGEIASAEAYRSAIGRGAFDTPGPGSGPSSPAAIAAAAQERRSAVLRRELEDLRLRYTPNHPLVRETQAQLAEVLKREELLDKQLEAERKADEARKADEKNKAVATAAPVVSKARPEVTQLLMREQERIALLKAQLANADQELQTRKNQEEEILKSISDYQARVEKLPIRQQEMASLLRDYEISRDNYKSLLNKDFSAEMASDMEKRQKSERFTVLDPAKVPEKPAKPNRPILNLIVVAVGFLLAVSFGYGQEWKKNVLLGEWEFPPGTVILGRVPAIAKPAAAGADIPAKPASPFKLRTRWVYSVILSLTLLLVIGLWLRRA
jgi:polysaccharide chain length determinant protein (PEP-CTERM system associated)